MKNPVQTKVPAFVNQQVGQCHNQHITMYISIMTRHSDIINQLSRECQVLPTRHDFSSLWPLAPPVTNLEGVTLGLKVKLTVHMTVNLLGLPRTNNHFLKVRKLKNISNSRLLFPKLQVHSLIFFYPPPPFSRATRA